MPKEAITFIDNYDIFFRRISPRKNYVLIILLAFLPILSGQKAIANPPINIDVYLEIIEHNRQSLSAEELALIESKIANSYFQSGKYEEAIKHWRSSIKINRGTQQNQLLAANLNDLAQAYLNLGQTLLAEKKLTETIQISQPAKLDNILYSAYLTLGNIKRIRSQYREAETDLNKSLSYASSPQEQVIVNTNLSQVFHNQYQKLFKKAQTIAQETEKENLELQALKYLEQAWSTANKSIELSEKIESFATVEAHLQLLKLTSISKNFDPNPYLNKAETILSSLPNSTRKLYALINLGELQQNPLPTLIRATEIAEQIKDNRSASFAFGRLGTYYEQVKQYDVALEWTKKAISAASEAHAYKSLYQWHWQAGKIHHILNQTEQAISAYNQAIASLQNIRVELARASKEQLDFSQEIEPVYRELLNLLLSNHPSSKQIEQALNIRDLLQLSELENYFGDDCFELITQQSNLLPQQTGVIHSVILPNATYIIFKQQQRLVSFKLDITSTQLEQLVKRWRYSLEDRSEDNHLALSQEIYNLLLKPLESELALNQTDKLIFINDGILKNVPMAALHNGQQFLIEDYAITFSLSLNLRLRDNQTFVPKTKILAFGLSEKTKAFSALPYVRQEIKSLSELTKVRQFLNTEFVADKVEKEVIKHNYPIIHFATHGKFDSVLEESFLETYRGRITVTNLVSILNQHQIKYPNNPIELLVLSACETAADRGRATLGLAGVAIRAGVRNSVGSLWAVSDKPEVYLIEEFYNNLLKKKNLPSEALRQAQIEMINADKFHPSVWANLILIAS